MASVRIDRLPLVGLGLVLAVGSPVLLDGALPLTVAGVVFATGGAMAIVARRREASTRLRTAIRVVTVVGAFGVLLVWTMLWAPLAVAFLFGVLFVWAVLALRYDIGPVWNSLAPGLGFLGGTVISVVKGSPYALFFGPFAFAFLWSGMIFALGRRRQVELFYAGQILAFGSIVVLGVLNGPVFVAAIGLLLVGTTVVWAHRERQVRRATETDT